MGSLNSEILFFTILIIAFITLLCFIMCLICFSKFHKLKSQMNNEIPDEKIQQLDEMIKKISNVQSVQNVAGTTNIINSKAFTKYAIVQFDAFSGMTGAYSFSLCMLNGENNGFILTTLYGHETCNTYLKQVTDSDVKVKLLDEEQKALNNAKAAN